MYLQPFKTLTYALLQLPNNNGKYTTIHLAKGVHNNSDNGESFPQWEKQRVTIDGVSRKSVIIDAEGTGYVFSIYDADGFSLKNLTITGGKTSELGGGIRMHVTSTNINIENVIISENSANLGGGIYCNGELYLKNVSLLNNTANRGGGIFFDDHGVAIFDSVLRCNIYNNRGGGQGNDLHAWGHRDPGFFNVFLDTFTVLSPGERYVYPINFFTLNIKNGYSGSFPDSSELQIPFCNFPNPFSESTIIEFSLPTTRHVFIDIFDILGKRVKSLLNNTLLNPDTYYINWNGINDRGQKSASGIYICRFKAESNQEFRKMIYIR